MGPTGTQGCTVVGPTGTQGCTQGGAQAQTIGYTGWYGCHNLGPTGTQGCTVVGPTGTQGCTMPPNCVGQTGWQGCHGGQTGANNTMATVCTQIGCGPTHLLGCTGYEGCHQPQSTAATVCTQVGCNDGGGAQAQIPTIPVADCIPTRSCTGAWPVC